MGNLKPYKKGQSGNPSGRPKGSLNWKTILGKMLDAEINGITAREEMILNAIRKAKSEKTSLGEIVRAIEFFANREDGKPKEYVEVETKTKDEYSRELLEEINIERKKNIPENFNKKSLDEIRRLQ